MAERTWTIELNDGSHVVELRHSYWTGRREIRLDGRIVHRGGNLLSNFGCTVELPVPGHEVAVLLRTNGVTFAYDLVVDGRSVTTEEEVDVRGPVLIGGLPVIAHIFGPLCFMIPIVARNGLDAVILGSIAGAGCVAVARMHRVPSSNRIWLCAGITAVNLLIQLLWSMVLRG